MKPIENWRQGWKFWSVRLAAFGGVLLGYCAVFPSDVLNLWASLPDEIRTKVPSQLVSLIGTLVVISSLVARFVAQPKAGKPAASYELSPAIQKIAEENLKRLQAEKPYFPKITSEGITNYFPNLRLDADGRWTNLEPNSYPEFENKHIESGLTVEGKQQAQHYFESLAQKSYPHGQLPVPDDASEQVTPNHRKRGELHPPNCGCLACGLTGDWDE